MNPESSSEHGAAPATTLLPSHFALGLALLAVVVCKAAYVFELTGQIGPVFDGVLDELTFASLLATVALFGTRVARPRPAAALRWACTLVGLAAGLVYVLSFVGYRVLGSLPRWAQLDGVTWQTVGPSIRPMVVQNKWLFATLVVLLAGSVAVLRRARGTLSVGAQRVPLVLTAVLAALELVVTPRHGQLVTAAFGADLSIRPVTPDEIARERAYFEKHERKLRTANGVAAPFAPLLEGPRGDIILLSMESVRSKDLAPWGGPIHVPHIEALLDHAVVIERMYAQDPRSSKSYSAFDMGLYSMPTWKTFTNDLTYASDGLSLPRELRGLGYHTVSMVNGDPLYDNHAPFQFARGYDEVLYQPEINPGSTASDDLRLLQRFDQVLEQNRDRKVYAMLWPLATHHPYTREYWSDMEGWLARHPEGISHRGAEDYQRYVRGLLDLDDFVGRLVALLEKRGRLQNATVLLVGDHGEAFGEHDPYNVFHGNNVYEESVHVAALAYSPKLSGARDPRYFMTKDVAATVFELAGGSAPYFGDGRSLLHTYATEMPVFLFGSWTRVAGIITNGQKYRVRVGHTAEQFLAPMSDIVRDENAELIPALWRPGDALRDELNEWLDAMEIRARRLLVNKEFEQEPLRDTLRVYCDPGAGFSEDNKVSAPYTLSHERVEVPLVLGRPCRSIRVAPSLAATFPKGQRGRFMLRTLEVELDDGTKKTLGTMPMVGRYGLDEAGPNTYVWQDKAPHMGCLDFGVGTEPVRVARVRVGFWLKHVALADKPAAAL